MKFTFITSGLPVLDTMEENPMLVMHGQDFLESQSIKENCSAP
jgi:hypothetical protein